MRATGRTSRWAGRASAFAMMVFAVWGQAEWISAQVPTVRAHLDPPEVGPEQSFSLVIELSGVQDFESVLVPVDPGLAQNGGFHLGTRIRAGPERVTSGGEVFSVRYAFFEPPGPGSYTIGPIQVVADGHALETEPLTLLVTANEQMSVRVRAEPPRVKRGDTFELIVEVVGGGRMTRLPELPDVFDFAEHTGGSGGSTDSFGYRMRATSVGEFEIPSIRVDLEGGTYETEPARLVVTDEPPAVDVRATIHSGMIWAGGEFVVRIEVAGVDDLDSEPVPPATEGFAELIEADADPALLPVSLVRPLGDRSLERHFRFRALKAGRFELGPVRILADGREFLTDPIEVVVGESPAVSTGPPTDALLMTLRDGRSERDSAYVNQPVILSFAILHRKRRWPDMSTGTVEWPSLEAFEAVELTRLGWRGEPQVALDGRLYNVLGVRRVAVLPRASGNLVIGPATVEAQFRSARQFGLRRPETGEFTSVILTSEPVALEVLPLPEAGRPESFRGHVGTLEVTSWVDRTSMAVGDTLTLQVEVDVEGYMRGLPEPEIDFPEIFEASSPLIRNAMHQDSDGLSGMRTYIYRLVAAAEGTRDIPAVEMSWFDPETEGYGVSRGQPFTITVVSAGGGVR